MEESNVQTPASQFNYSTPPSNKSKKILKLIIFAVILVGIIFGIQKFFFGGKEEAKPVVVTPTPTEYQFPTDTPAPSVSPTSEPKPTATVAPTTKAINPVDAETGLDRSTLSVEVQNGSGVTGAASKGADVLKSFGYKISAIGNADNENYENVTIRVKSTKTNFLALLKKDLGFSYTIGSASSDLDPSSTADALVIIGK